MNRQPDIIPAGDRALSIVFPEEISEEISCRVLDMCAAIDAAHISGIVGCIPSYHTLLVEYDPLALGFWEAEGKIRALPFSQSSAESVRTVEIPVCYGGEFGPDLGFVASHAGLSENEVMRLHTEAAYRVYMLGFRPGFPYLGGMDPRIAAPRRKTPRGCIVGGSVGIAGGQTGIYPENSPGGWQIIGRTPLRLYDEERGALLRPGDRLRFTAVSREAYDEILHEKEGKSWRS